jgi:5-methylcytosine-specific restriction endonuclease McrA
MLTFCLDKGRLMDSISSMTCTQCGKTKPLKLFMKASDRPKGRKQPCKACSSLAVIRKRNERFAEDPEGYKAWNKTRGARDRTNNHEKILERLRQWQKTHRGHIAAYRKQDLLDHPEKMELVRARGRKGTHRYRARKNGNPYIEDVSTEVIYKREKGICQLCHKPCKRTEASQDHIIPVSLGGETSYRNIVLAHKKCNSAKQARTVPQQMRLIG